VAPDSDATRTQVEDRVEQLLDRIWRMSDDDFVLIRAVWNVSDERPRADAWLSVKQVLKARDRGDILDRTRTRLAAWASGQRAGLGLQYGTTLMSPGVVIESPGVRRDALPPLLDAVAATVAADGLEAEDREALLEPLSQVASPGRQ